MKHASSPPGANELVKVGLFGTSAMRILEQNIKIVKIRGFKRSKAADCSSYIPLGKRGKK